MSFTSTTTTTTTPSAAAASAALTRAKAAAEGSPSWDELLGSKNWAGLLEPELNLSLREFILRSGNFCQATYDAFNSTPESPNCGNSNFGKANFFNDVMLKDASRYQVVSFLYATAGVAKEKSLLVHSRSPNPWDAESNWFGYVAVTTDKVSRAIGRREVYVAWRGTVMQEEWMSNILGALPVPVKPLLSECSTAYKWGRDEPKVHDGWLKIYTSQNSHSPYVKTSAREQLHAAIEAIKNRYAGEKLSIVVVGHSLGGALATLSGFDLAENNVAGGADDVRIAVVGFGCPEVGNPGFKDHVGDLPNLKILHVTNIHDRVPSLPDFLLTLYVPIDTAELEIDSRSSPYLKRKILMSETLVDSHNLEANLHLVAGWNGKGKAFEMKVKRSLALVNKAGDILKDEFKVPASWWSERNKGMEYDAAADEWIFDPPPPAEQMISISFA